MEKIHRLRIGKQRELIALDDDVTHTWDTTTETWITCDNSTWHTSNTRCINSTRITSQIPFVCGFCRSSWVSFCWVFQMTVFDSDWNSPWLFEFCLISRGSCNNSCFYMAFITMWANNLLICLLVAFFNKWSNVFQNRKGEKESWSAFFVSKFLWCRQRSLPVKHFVMRANDHHA